MSSHEAKASGALPSDDPLYAPGLKRRSGKRVETIYWIPPAKDIKAGWHLRAICVTGTELEIADKCRRLWAELEAWRSGKITHQRFTIAWLIRRYQTDPLSPYKKVREKTRQGYDTSCKIIDATRGDVRIDAMIDGGLIQHRISGADVRQWHHDWGQPDAAGIPTTPVRARHCIEMLRILFSYAVEINVPGAKDLREGLLKVVTFPSTPARAAAPSRAMVKAIVHKAIEKGWRSIAIATLAQFEFTERRISIIGIYEDGQWRPGWIWQNISPTWRVSYQQNKVGVVPREFDLQDTPALLELLQATPEEKRIGPVVICETTGKPWKFRHYCRVFRKIAKEAGVPDDVWSMDMRAGGATEADSLPGLTMKELQAAGGWTTEAMAQRYSRGGIRAAQNVVKLRQKATNSGN